MASLLLPYNKTSYEEHGTYDLLRRADKCAGEVTRATSILPRRDAQGHSECPFAEELYETARAWMAELKDQLGQLYAHERSARAAANGCRRTARESRRSDDPRHTDDWQRHEAEAAQHDERLQEVQRKIEVVKEALDAATTRLR